MNEIILIIAILSGIVIGAAIFYFLWRRNDKGTDINVRLDVIEKTFEKLLSSIKVDINDQLRSSRELMDSSNRGMHERVKDFTESITSLRHNVEQVHKSVENSVDKMSSFQNIFKTPKLRGQWGEANLEYILSQVYPEERILKQYQFKNGEAVDFAIKLPNDFLLPIDSKFPLETYISYAEESVESAKTPKMQVFIRRVKEEIDSISAKYIKPEENTTNRAIMFVPAEAVYYDIMFSLTDAELVEYASKKGVVLASPNTLNMTLSVFEHWFRDITVSKKTQEIIKRLGTILLDGKRLGESYDKLGKHITNVKSSYDETGKRIELLTERVDKVITIGEGGLKQLADKE
ncbi:hypothetical protein A2926_02830 [Candidatus Giovannonibacteria bacterium RIFCSPLOWO2_01_FULL_44_40]|uniref:DNA recombination protein RmuC n=1 Tax=Candidatus Giovannonibacteria bacterium RIFCSPHIGHO2_01_FULL_45_23 TaxID=1798325 RepID=A0A1F5VEB9_9BACT|nr:MAG: hypothetical protein A2834_00950 [Candidatus Giovannonibacteria bacterium RIFCSPHIGHO2_01_FULL_45_23]OGF75272.1 MAG: hypothetical protein A3C77_02760 [Candidatus Giovannonibacteria bacterium RIFCSPHIGHO2_02_FULL_45_13]OGF79948.1 MAG: hypothetical protein A2926_02830 [Candidatus Giovannonibacteria bacterium RIFCSPLOWO2_01_FULL_44_40]